LALQLPAAAEMSGEKSKDNRWQDGFCAVKREKKEKKKRLPSFSWFLSLCIFQAMVIGVVTFGRW
jgi:hypothetical protein